jgi:hypothetical protein
MLNKKNTIIFSSVLLIVVLGTISFFVYQGFQNQQKLEKKKLVRIEKEKQEKAKQQELARVEKERQEKERLEQEKAGQQKQKFIPSTKTDCKDELDTACWNTYRNEEYGFEVKIPMDWEIDSTRSRLNEVVFNVGIPSIEAINFEKNIDNLTFDELREQKINYYNDVISKKIKTIVDNKEALQINTREFGIKRIFFVHNNFIYEVITGGRINNLGILDSFKFIN